MGFAEAIATCFSKYFRFNGRARRSEYWWFFLFQILVSLAADIADNALHLGVAMAPYGAGHHGWGHNGPIHGLVSLLLFFPALAVAVRRLHDTKNSGFLLLGFIVYLIAMLIAVFWLLGWGWYTGTWNDMHDIPIVAALALIAFLYALWLFILTLMKGTNGPNKYGDDPIKSA